MAIDLRQFHQTFFDESQEGLAAMESVLLDMESHTSRTLDTDALNLIFRVVHSIKGGSGTFGFGWLTDFSHTLETFMEPVRAGQRPLDRAVAGLLLRSVDCLRGLLASERHGKPVNKAMIDDVVAQLVVPQETQATACATSSTAQHWHILFVPNANLFESGNDPLRILRELSDLGSLQVHVDVTHLPSWENFNPEKCYLGWDLELNATCTRATIQEVFAWVADDCELKIDQLDTQPLPTATSTFAEAATGEVRARSTSIRVSTEKMDALVDIVGELVITQTMLNQTATLLGAETSPQLTAGLALLERNLRQLQEDVMRIRMLPIGFIFSRLPRLVRDVGEQLGKKVNLHIAGEATELDKSVIERISDPILHMVRNSLDHGIESPSERLAAGKPETGQIRLEAHQRGGNVIIEIDDDGRGLSLEKIQARAIERGLIPASAKLSVEQAYELIFQPGFTTSASVSDLSGRGVGLDVVRNNIYALGGNVDIASQTGRGTRFTIRMPLTLAILDGLGVEVGQQIYIVPLANITESLRPTQQNVHRLPGGEQILAFRQEHIPLIRLTDLFHTRGRDPALQQDIIVVVEANGRHVGLIVDDLLGQQQVVIKSLDSHYRRVDGIAAATILGDGTVAYILDVASLVRRTSAATRGLDTRDPAGRHRHTTPPHAALH